MRWYCVLFHFFVFASIAEAQQCSEPVENALAEKQQNKTEQKEQVESLSWIERLLTLSGRSERIVGGDRACPGDWPYFATLRYSSTSANEYFCGGVMIGTEWLLTAGHCVAGLKLNEQYGWYQPGRGRLEAVVGVVDTLEVPVDSVFQIQSVLVHPNYNRFDRNTGAVETNDIALVRVTEPWRGEKAQLSALPWSIDADEAYGRGFTAGLGLTSVYETNEELLAASPELVFDEKSNRFLSMGSRFLLSALVPLLPGYECSDQYNAHDVRTKICAGYFLGGRDTCAGDSGGPLVALDKEESPYLIGITSYGRGCASADGYGVYTRVSAYNEWIKRYVPDVSFTTNPPESDHTIVLSAEAALTSKMNHEAQALSISIGDQGTFTDGDLISLTVDSNADGNLLILDLNPSGGVTQLFPNRYMASSNADWISSGERIEIPSREAGNFRLRARAEPPGEGRIVAILIPTGQELPEALNSSLNKALVPKTEPSNYVLNLFDFVERNAFEQDDVEGGANFNGWSAASAAYRISP